MDAPTIIAFVNLLKSKPSDMLNDIMEPGDWYMWNVLVSDLEEMIKHPPEEPRRAAEIYISLACLLGYTIASGSIPNTTKGGDT